jgi:integrase
MSTGSIRRRGAHWQLRWPGEPGADGRRKTLSKTIVGTKRQAQIELARCVVAEAGGIAVDPTAVTVAQYTRKWIAGASHLAGKTGERYSDLAEQQIIPHLGRIGLQRLRPAHVVEWHVTLLQSGGKGGAPLSARTVGHAHRLLHAVLTQAAQHEVVSRNVASFVRPPAVKPTEITILSSEQIETVLLGLHGNRLAPIAALALGAGLRRGELCALRWDDIDLDRATLRVECSMEETRATGLRVKGPKTRHGRRSLTLPVYTVERLRTHWGEYLKQRLALGLGRPGAEDFVFTLPDGSPWGPNYLSRVWRQTMTALNLPDVGLHGLRHSHASALIAAGVDALTISRRLGHASPSFTLTTYGHLFTNTDAAAALAIDAVLGAGTSG